MSSKISNSSIKKNSEEKIPGEIQYSPPTLHHRGQKPGHLKENIRFSQIH